MDNIQNVIEESPQAAVDLMNRALEDSLNLPPNSFSPLSHYVPVGEPSHLNNVCDMIQSGQASVVTSYMVNGEYGVYRINIRNNADGGAVTYWVNRQWASRILNLTWESPTDSDTPETPSDNVSAPVIPENSPTISESNVTSRFSGAMWYGKIIEQNVVLAGLGGIGSYVGFLLSRLKVNRLTIYDLDIVEDANMSGQLYSRYDIGRDKSTALAIMMSNYSEYFTVTSRNERYTSRDGVRENVMMCGFDNMSARRTFYNSWKSHVGSCENPERCLFVDGRLAAEEFQVFAIQGNDKRAMEEYEGKWLFDDSEADETICSYRQTSFTANMIASVMVNCFVNFVANLCGPMFERAVPFMTSYSAETMFLKTVM